MRLRIDKKIKAAALAIRDDCALYAELLQDDDGYSIVNADTFELPAGLVESDHIKDPERLGAFLRKKCAFRWGKLPLAVALPSSDCIFRTFSLRVADLDEARTSMRWTFSDYFPFKYDESLFDLMEIPGGSPTELRLLGVACERKVVMPVLEALKNSRFQVQSAEPGIVACARAFSHPDETGTRLLVAGVGRVVHFVFFRDGAALLFRSLYLTAGDGAAKIDEEIRRTTEYITENFTKGVYSQAHHEFDLQTQPVRGACIPLHSIGNLPPSLASAAKMLREKAEDFYPVKFNPPADDGWFDVAGLLLRYAP